MLSNPNLPVEEQFRRVERELMKVVARCEAAVEQTLFTQASLIAAEQRSLAPVDEGSDTPGAARESVRVEQGAPKGNKAIVVKIKAGGHLTRKTSANGRVYDYVRAIVFGTVDTPAFDFFFTVFRARKKGAKAAVRKAVKLAVRQTFR